jgi:hypothetical protein
MGDSFWLEWINADTTARFDLVKKLPICKMLANGPGYSKLKPRDAMDSAALFLNSYFEDLYETMLTGGMICTKLN